MKQQSIGNKQFLVIQKKETNILKNQKSKSTSIKFKLEQILSALKQSCDEHRHGRVDKHWGCHRYEGVFEQRIKILIKVFEQRIKNPD